MSPSFLSTMEHTITLAIEECCTCGVAFGIPKNLRKHLQETGDTFYCPVGHPQHYSETFEQKFKQAKSRISLLEQSESFWKSQAEEKAVDLKNTRAELTRTKNRVSKGICPCCNRQFIQLTKHMKTKHPEYSG